MLDVWDDIETALAKQGCGIVRRVAPVVQEPVKRDWIRLPVSQEVSHNRLANLAQLVSDLTLISVKEILGRRRAAPICRARHLCLYLAKIHTNYTYPRMGLFFGGRDHTVIMHSVNKVADNPQAFEPELSQALKLLGVPADIAA